MGESSTCLVRSISTQEGDPIRALSESISFGRFMSESLDWEKWSAFTQKRYVEEAEKYSKPGSVAAKKAYFEAHYKRKAAEKEAALVQEENAQARTFDSATQEGICADSSIMMKSKANNDETANEQLGEEDAVVDCVDTNQYKCDVGQSDSDIYNLEGADDVPHPCVDMNLDVESCILVENSNQFDPVEIHKNVTIPEEEKKPEPGTAGEEVVEGEEVNSSPKLSTKSKAAKLSHSHVERKASAAVPLPPRNGINCVSKSKNRVSIGDTVEKKRLTAGSLRMSINLPSGTGGTSKTASAASQSRSGLNNLSTSKKRIIAPSLSKSINLSSGTGVSSKTATAAVKARNGINLASKCMKSDSVEKRSTARSLHMSINLPSGADKTSEIASVFEHNRIKRIHCNLPKYRPPASQALSPTKASHGLLNEASENPLSHGRRTERRVNKSVFGGVTTVNANGPTLSVDCSKPLSTVRSNPQAHTKSLPFRFRSEERAIKRKEFLLKMDETKSKEEEKVKLQRTPKGKTDHYHKKLPQRSGSISKLNEDGSSGTQSPTKEARKISLTLPGPPKAAGVASSSTVHDKTKRNSWKPPISINNSKHVTGKINQATRQSRTSSNTTRENSSPNIQQ